MVAPSEAVAAHRLVLSAAEFAVLVDVCGMTPPTGFGTASMVPQDPARPTVSLVERGVLGESGDPPGYQPVESVAVNLAVLTGPAVTVQVDVSAGERGLRSVFAVSGP